MADDVQTDFGNLRVRTANKPHLSESQVNAIGDYVQAVMSELGMSWTFYVARYERPPKGCGMMIEPIIGRRTFSLYVAKWWWKHASDEDKRQHVTHELLHLLHHDLDTSLWSFLDDYADDLPKRASERAWSDFKVDLERMVDALSILLAPHMPRWTGKPRDE